MRTARFWDNLHLPSKSKDCMESQIIYKCLGKIKQKVSCFYNSIFRGTCKMRNEMRNGTKRNETKRNLPKRNETERNETKRNGTK